MVMVACRTTIGGACLTALLVLLVACAEAPLEPAAQTVLAAPAPAPKPPLFHSSVAAVLAHQGELQLTEEQTTKMGDIDRQMLAANEAIRAANQPGGNSKDKKAATPGSGKSSEATPGSAPTNNGQDSNSPGGSGGGRGPGGGGGRGMGRGGGFRHGLPGGSSSSEAKHPDAQAQMDENDTKAYFDAEALLSQEQQLKARDIAEAYREQLYEWREAVRAQKAGAKSPP
jgi:hypothetical protein